jgi:hypothetical protein
VSSELRQSNELQLIACDGDDLCQLMLALTSHPEASTIGLGILPYLAFYAIESYDWLNRVLTPQDLQHLLPDHVTLRQIRAKLKLFDGDQDGLDNVSSKLSTIEQQSINWFNHNHRGILGSFKKHFQNDLGCTFIGHDLIMTTHISLVNTGFDITDFDPSHKDAFSQVGKRLFESSRELSKFISIVANSLKPLLFHERNLSITSPGIFNFSAIDYKSGQVYPQLRTHFGLEESSHVAPVTWMISQVNFVHLVSRRFFSSESDIYFRTRFLTVFHSLNSLRIISTANRNSRDSLIFQVAASILKTPESRAIRKLGNLRNVVAHYSLPFSVTQEFAPDQILGGAVPHFCSRTTTEINSLVDQCLSDMSTQFRRLMTKESLGGNEIHLDQV